MRYLSLHPFVPSGENFPASKELFLELGFEIEWESVDSIGFTNDSCGFILQHYNNKTFAENFMLSVGVSNAEEFRQMVFNKKLPERFGISVSEVIQQPYGK